MPLRVLCSSLFAFALMLPLQASAAPVQTRLLGSLENPNVIAAGKYHASDASVTLAKDVEAQVGSQALSLNLTALGAGGKGDFTLNGVYPGYAQSLAIWAYLPKGHTLKNVGFQINDNEGESLISLIDANWQGWKRISIPVDDANFKQTYPQKDRNGKIDLPVKGVHVAFFVNAAGPTSVIIDGIEGQYPVNAEDNNKPLQIELASPTDVSLGEKATATLVISNPTSATMDAQVQLILQANPTLADLNLPDPVLGRDHALLASSVTIADGKEIATNTLTDNDENSSAQTSYSGKETWESADQIVTLDKTRTITAMKWRSGDANWVAKVNISASMDGKNYTPVDELQNVDIYKKWGEQSFKFNTPFAARYLKFHYHDNGKLARVIRMPSALMIYDGMDDEATDIPVTGTTFASVNKTVQVPALNYQVLNMPMDKPLTTGSYVLVAKITNGNKITLAGQEIFCEPTRIKIDPSSRFGLNASRWSLATEHAKLGIGWVRFENFKWPMVSGKPNEYSFNPGPAPWSLDIDDAMKTYTDAGISVIPMMFLTPNWAADEVPGLKDKMKLSRVPRSNDLFAQFAYQTVARYGSKKIPSDKLLTQDKVSGKNLIKYFELGNEPDLNPYRGKDLPTWGAWVGTVDQFWETYKAGALAVKEADPDAKVPSPGFAGVTTEVVDSMRSYTYADGTHPIDYCDMLSVHFYSGRTPPEIAAHDSNNAKELKVTFDEQVRRTCEWRDRNKPGIPIWLTETGYDTGGPIGTNERTQSARLPRVVMISLHNGFDKVIVYRESGSTPTQHAAAGVLRNDLTRRPSWYSYATLIRQLDDVTPDQQIDLGVDNTWAYTWNRDGKLLITAWSITDTAPFKLELGPATVTDAFGASRKVSSTADLQLSEFPQYISDFSTNSTLNALRDKAQNQRELRKTQRNAEAKRNAYLYDFGKNLESESLNLGKMRSFNKVPAQQLYTKDTGFGFENNPGIKDEFTHWMKNPLDRNSVITQAASFRCDLAPGTYDIAFRAESRKNLPVTLDTGTQQIKLQVTKDEPGQITLKITSGHLRIITEDQLTWRYLTIIEQK